MIVEVCANSFLSAHNAQEAGAQRIELCQELGVGGITPSYGLIKQVQEVLKIPVFVLIRPRGGNFVYSETEFNCMMHNIELCKELGCAGIVSGVLHPDKTIDLQRTKVLIECSRPLYFTFHRAFDEVANLELALEQLIDLGADRVLTSGQDRTAEKGLELLKTLHHFAQGRIKILAGGGISADNAFKFKAAGLKEIHASASSVVPNDGSKFGMDLTYSDKEKIKSILNAL